MSECRRCHGEGYEWVTPVLASYPSGYEPGSDIKLKVCVVCDDCEGKGTRK